MVCSIEVFQNNDSINTVLHFDSLEHCERILLTFLSWVGRKLKHIACLSGNSHSCMLYSKIIRLI